MRLLVLVLGCNDTILDGRISVACGHIRKGDKILVADTPHEACYMKAQMIKKYKVDPNIILMDIQSKTTIDNIFLNREYINRFSTVLLVTSQSHMVRSEKLLRLVYRGKIEMAYSEDKTTEVEFDGYFENAKMMVGKINRKKF